MSGPMSADGRILVSVENHGARPGYVWGFGASVKKYPPPQAFELDRVYEFDMRLNSFDGPSYQHGSDTPGGEESFFATIKPFKPLLNTKAAHVRCGIMYYGEKTVHGPKIRAPKTD